MTLRPDTGRHIWKQNINDLISQKSNYYETQLAVVRLKTCDFYTNFVFLKVSRFVRVVTTFVFHASRDKHVTALVFDDAHHCGARL